MSLTDAERESLAACFVRSTRSPKHLAFLAAPAVEQIVTAHVTEALTNAADLMSNFLHDPECETCDDVRDCIAIVRSAIP